MREEERNVRGRRESGVNGGKIRDFRDKVNCFGIF